MQKLDMLTPDIIQANIETLSKLFPNIITETENADGTITKAIDYDLFRQMFASTLVEGGEERYRLDWPGKRASILKANTPISKTLRPVVADSVNWDTTKNLYIEGDNFEVLKVLQESYLGKVKMIYIDPPYNTGKDFVYTDNFKVSIDEYEEGLEIVDEEGGRLVRNTDTNGRFHSDWLTMMYERLVVARDLLTDDGVIFMSIDDNEVQNLRKISDEIFGEDNLVGIIANINNPKGRSDDKYIATAHEYLIVYAKSIQNLTWSGFEPTEEIIKRYNKIDKDGKYREIDLRKTGDNDLKEDRPNLFYYFYFNELSGDFYPSKNDEIVPGYIQIFPQREDGKFGNWRWGIDTAKSSINSLIPKFMPTRKIWGVMEKDYLENRSLVKPTSSWTFKDVNSERGSEEFIKLGFDKNVFPKPKPLGTILRSITLTTKSNDIILDFFSGSATTAQAVMQLNTEDGGNRKFIMVQIPEETDKDSEAYKAGYMNICEIGKERIRRAGKKIVEENKDKEGIENLDIGFRVYRLDSSNMKDVYYHPTEVTQDSLFHMESNIKPDRTPEDILAQVMLDLGLTLDLSIEKRVIHGSTVFSVAGNSLVACFDEHVDFALVDTIAKDRPLRVVLRDSSFSSDADRINFETRFAKLSPETDIRVI